MKRTRSIRWKFTVVFACLMALEVLAIWSVNHFFLAGYYQNYKIDVLERGYRSIDAIIREEEARGGTALDGTQDTLNEDGLSLYGRTSSEEWDGVANGAGKSGLDSEGKGNMEQLADVVRQLRDTSNITLLIYDSMKDQTLVSSGRDVEIMQNRVRQYIVGYGQLRREILREYDNYMIQKTFDPLTKTFFLESWGFFSDNSTIFIMTTPLESIHESARISNRFLMYVGIIVILVGSILTYYITRHVTAPIQRLSQLSEKMSNLDFDVRFVSPRHSTDELDTLGTSMNVLSERLKETIGQLQSANEKLRKDIDEKIQIDELRKEFIANVSHELKTPIALIQGYAEGLVEGMAEDPENRDYYCGVIMDEAGKMNKMVRQLLTLTALEFGNEQAVMERFDVTELIRSVLSSSGLVMEQKGIRAEFAPQGPVWVLGDEFKIEEVITNYLTNAMNHADGERKIQIWTEEEPDGNRVRVSVFNTGTPIPEEALAGVWTKFYKVDKARTRAYGGSGIGLSIVKAIMESHHQSYGVWNREDGVVFWFTLKSIK